jgi:hypothetical protein
MTKTERYLIAHTLCALATAAARFYTSEIGAAVSLCGTSVIYLCALIAIARDKR